MKTNVMAYYFPNFHPTEMNERVHGTGWTEWEVARCAMPRFEGHYQPKVPLWGYENENDVAVMEKKINFAKENGIDGFIWDWYWFNDGPYRIDALDNAFLKANEGKDFKLAIMWANHDASYAHPANYKDIKANNVTNMVEGRTKTQNPMFLKDGNLTKQGFIEGTDHCIQNYFVKDYYYRVNGKLYFGFFRPDMLVQSFGSIEATREMIDDFRDRVRKAGLGELDIFVNYHCIPGSSTKERCENAIKMGIDTVGYYNSGDGDDLPFPHCRYDVMVKNSNARFDGDYPVVREYGLNYSITASMGWDVSPRTVQSDMYEDIGYPFSRIVNDSTPDKFEACLVENRAFCEKNEIQTFTVFAFNEWTEGGYLEPDTKWGDGYAKAIKNAFGR